MFFMDNRWFLITHDRPLPGKNLSIDHAPGSRIKLPKSLFRLAAGSKRILIVCHLGKILHLITRDHCKVDRNRALTGTDYTDIADGATDATATLSVG